MTLMDRLDTLATTIGNYLRDSVLPRLVPSGGTAGQVLSKSSATNYAAAWVTPSSGGALPYATASLAADVQLTTTGTWYDGPSLTLAAGTWLILADAQFNRTATTATQWIARISDGTNHYASGQTYQASASGQTDRISLQDVVTLAAPTTVKLQATTSAGATAALLKAATPNSGSGNNATGISAVRIA